MQSKLEDSNIDRVSILRAKHIVQQELGKMRSFASAARHANPAIDEEEFFKVAAEGWIRGICHEVTRIFGPERASQILNIWSKKND